MNDGDQWGGAPRPPAENGVIALQFQLERASKLLDDFEARFPAGPPSLARAERLVVRGDVRFGRDVTVVGGTGLGGPRSPGS